MGSTTAISWTDHTFNPWWGCVKVSAGCTNCYAETFSERTGYVKGGAKGGPIWGPAAPRRFFGDKHWAEPLKWDEEARKEGRQHKVFCASMADVFELNPHLVEHRMRLFKLIEHTPFLTWQLLTKRPENIAKMLPVAWHPNHGGSLPRNIWFGTSIEDNEVARERVSAIVKFQDCWNPAIIWGSFEPLLERLAIIPQLDWAVFGGESGNNRRDCGVQAIERTALAFKLCGVPVFVKQDSHRFPGQQGRISDEVWSWKEFPL